METSSFAEEVCYVVVGVRSELIAVQVEIPQINVDALAAEVELEKFDFVVR